MHGCAYIMGAYEHPTRKVDHAAVGQLHAEVAKGALDDAGLGMADVDGYFCAGVAPGFGPLSMLDYLVLNNMAVVKFSPTDDGACHKAS